MTCLNKKLLKFGWDSFLKNNDLAVDCITISDAIKARVQSKLKINLQHDVSDSTASLFDIDKYDNKVKSEKKYTSALKI